MRNFCSLVAGPSLCCLVVLVGTGCPPEPTSPPPPINEPRIDEECGDLPELPYVCPDGQLPCACEGGSDGVARWRCFECENEVPDDGIDGEYCDQNADAVVCVKDAACVACHGLATSSSSGGIENSHAWSYVACVDCHGGVGRDEADPTRRLSQDEAHVAMPVEMRVSVEDLSTPQRDQYTNRYLALAGVELLDDPDTSEHEGLAWLRFRNPGDLRVVDNSCAVTGCHAGMGERVRRSTMATAVGKLDGMLHLLGAPRA